MAALVLASCVRSAPPVIAVMNAFASPPENPGSATLPPRFLSRSSSASSLFICASLLMKDSLRRAMASSSARSAPRTIRRCPICAAYASRRSCADAIVRASIARACDASFAAAYARARSASIAAEASAWYRFTSSSLRATQGTVDSAASEAATAVSRVVARLACGSARRASVVGSLSRSLKMVCPSIAVRSRSSSALRSASATRARSSSSRRSARGLAPAAFRETGLPTSAPPPPRSASVSRVCALCFASRSAKSVTSLPSSAAFVSCDALSALYFSAMRCTVLLKNVSSAIPTLASAAAASRRAFEAACFDASVSAARRSRSAFAFARFRSSRSSPVLRGGTEGCAARSAADPGAGGSPDMSGGATKTPSLVTVRYFGFALNLIEGAYAVARRPRSGAVPSPSPTPLAPASGKRVASVNASRSAASPPTGPAPPSVAPGRQPASTSANAS